VLNGSGASKIAGRPANAAGDPNLPREQARRASYDADLKKLKLEERLCTLIPVVEVQSAMTDCGNSMVRGIEQIATRSEDMVRRCHPRRALAGFFTHEAV
jgi:hypothetical protein